MLLTIAHVSVDGGSDGSVRPLGEGEQ